MVIEYKGKKILNEGLSGWIAAEIIGNDKNCILDNLESSKIKNTVLKVKRFSGMNQPRPVQDDVVLNPKNDRISGKGNIYDKEFLNETLNCNEQGNVGEVIGDWSKPKHIRIDFKNEQVELSDDGIAVKLNPVIEAKNLDVLKNSIVIKVLGGNVPYSVCSFDMRKQWNKFGGFHMTSIGMNWILCSFKTCEAVDEVLNGGPWYVNGYIVGMDRWSPAFDPYSFKGISALVWIRLPCLPLFCWDEDSLARIASRFSTPLYLDGNTFRRGKREFALICVKIDLEKKLPNGVWIDGLAGRFFQWVEYEKINLLCYHCGRAGHELKTSPEKVVLGIKNQAMGNSKEVIGEVRKTDEGIKTAVTNAEYGPWIHVQFKNRRVFKDNDIVCHEEKEDSVKLLIKRKEGMSTDAVIEIKPSLNGSARVKLAKEGARKREAALYLKEVVKGHDVFFIGLMETKMSIINRKDVDVLIGKEWDFYHFPAVGLSGGILVLWNTKIGNFVITDTSSQVIVGDLSIPRMGSWRIATLYGSRCCKERETLWSLLEKCMVSSNPSIIGGDFNCVLNRDEKRGGKRFLFTEEPRDMKGFMASCDFHDVGIIGPRHLARVASDHSPITFKVNDKERVKSKIIRFEDTWRMYPAATSIVYNSWMKNDFGEEGMVLQRKINRTLKALFFWSKSKCKDLNELKVQLKIEIMELQSKEAMGNDWSAQDLILLRSKIHEHNVTLKRLSTWWNQRAKARWLKEGDYNSKLFHNFGMTRRNGWPEILDHQKMNDEDIKVLSSDFSVMELKKSIFQQGNNHSPDSLIVLIAKEKNPLLPSNYHPISLCQTNYKVVATMLVNRLKMCMPKMITEEQMAFIPGRSISEHCLLAQEILHKFKVSRNRKGMMALKLDMEQAYDSMGWPTLDHVLKWYGFPSGYANLVMECIIDVRFSIIINGRNSKWIMAHSGIRQGCPLSLYLYIMCSQFLSNSIYERGLNIGIQISPRGPRITHLLYADDVIIFSQVSMEIAKEVKSIVDDFCNWTGQRVNTNKSQIIFRNIVSNHMRKKVTKVLSFKVVKEMSYLGIKLSLNRLRAADFYDILTNMMDRLNTWGKKFLSLGDGGKFLKNITTWNVGNGKEIKLMLENDHWNTDLLEEKFHTKLVKMISSIHVDSSRDDLLEMQKFCPGRTVSGLAFEQVLKRRFSLIDDDYYNWLNKLKLSKKEEMFWWRLGNSSIPTNLYLKNRKLLDNDSCARGSVMVESYEHIIVQCKYLIEIIN
ncbi:hypothetical protein KFK09_028366 [Dendrobium nobile]|uniref:Reverse transcriptase domain-containing protein n=1 Tax=Dendrobium nobile TaxID=94219 RepID=A0A8T3A2X3_DENNO|nr:hypothetical protein KFK09_028366 [Dendrobium nobile]